MLRGVCCFHSETGTEGGYWAFQDSQFITKSVPRPYCKKCGKYLDSQVLPVTEEVIEGKEPPECPEGRHEREVDDSWSYEGLHILKNGDHLTVFSPDNPTRVVWSGTISLRQCLLFTEGTFGFEDTFGLWIHADQEGIDREEWATYFLKEYPAELIPVHKS